MTESRTEFAARRKLLAGALSFAALSALGAPRARAANAFDGTWAGLDADGETVQIIFVDGDIIGFYWRGDYLDAGGARLAFAFKGGQAVVSRSGAAMTIVIRDRGGESRVELKKD